MRSVVGVVGWWNSAAAATKRAFQFHWQPQKKAVKCPPLLSVDSPDVWIPTTTTTDASSAHPSSSFTANEGTAKILDGKSIAKDIKSRIAGEIREMKNSIEKIPGLGVIQVGKRRDSHVFVHTKMKACEKVGIASAVIELPEDCQEGEVRDAVSRLNANPSIHGIIVQLPLPKHMDEEKIINAVSVEKDVDGFHPLNIGNLAIKGREPLFIPCATKACLELLLRYGVELKGKQVALIGSKIVGLPTSLLLQRNHATMTVVHAFTKNPELVTCEADVVVSDVGVPNIDDKSLHGYGLVGDVCYEEASRKVSAITPVPGGVGPVTISMLLSNTLDSAKRLYNIT